jgi:dTDP-4-dehydrorhamnose 3,5-epimerase
MGFRDGPIEGVTVTDFRFFHDERGWLAEVFRQDELNEEIYPAMAYVSMTLPGVQRGPHAHRDQTDYFVFNSSVFKLVLWDGRKDSPTYMNRMVLHSGSEDPKYVVVPPGVVHAYKNVGDENGLVLNLPNRLYAGWDRKEPVDEVRYEDDPDSIYRVDE